MNQSQEQTGTLFVLPNTLGKTPENNTIPEYVLKIIRSLDTFIVENIKSAASYLRWTEHPVPEYEIDYFLLDKKTSQKEIASFLDPLLKGKDVGLLSEAGCPVVADPGSDLIDMAHSRGIEVKPLVGPSSILLALMGSGLTGSRFVFMAIFPEMKRKGESISNESSRSRKRGTERRFLWKPLIAIVIWWRVL